jgi:hypothetical protein
MIIDCRIRQALVNSDCLTVNHYLIETNKNNQAIVSNARKEEIYEYERPRTNGQENSSS